MALDSERIREMMEYGYGGGIPTNLADLNMLDNNTPSKKKKKSAKQATSGGTSSLSKNDDFEKLRAEAIRLNKEVGSDKKPYIPKQESDSKIIKFK